MSYTDDVLKNAKPCPFCRNAYTEELNITAGSQSDENGSGLWDFYNVFCDCGATGPHGETPEHAVELWNERALFRSHVYILIHHIGGDGKAEICGVYSSPGAAEQYCVDDSWGYFAIELDAISMRPDVVYPVEYIYPKRSPSRFVYGANGWEDNDE